MEAEEEGRLELCPAVEGVGSVPASDAHEALYFRYCCQHPVGIESVSLSLPAQSPISISSFLQILLVLD